MSLTKYWFGLKLNTVTSFLTFYHTFIYTCIPLFIYLGWHGLALHLNNCTIFCKAFSVHIKCFHIHYIFRLNAMVVDFQRWKNFLKHSSDWFTCLAFSPPANMESKTWSNQVT